MTPAVSKLVTQAQGISAAAAGVLAEAPMPLQPHTARLCAQTIRLAKGILIAVEEWVREESHRHAPQA